jgi:hypothetical protein
VDSHGHAHWVCLDFLIFRLFCDPANCCRRTFSTLVFPIALEAISWKLYMIVGSWDFLEFFFVLFLWVETKGLSLEEIDRLIDGKKHSNVPDLRTVEDASRTLEHLDAKEGSSLDITDLGSEELKKE